MIASFAVIAALAIPFTQEVVAYSLVQSRWGHLAYGLVFGALLVGLSTGWRGMMVSPVLCWMGDRSFSAYLWHFAFLTILGQAGAFGFVPEGWPSIIRFGSYLAMVGVATFAMSAVTYRWLERPMIGLGSRVARSLPSQRPMVTKAA